MVDHTHNGGPPIDDDRVGNWFAVSREIFSHPIVGVGDRSYTDLEAWLSLLAMASYEPRRAMNKGTVIVLDPGDLMAAHSYLATRWKWTADKVRWFLKRLQNEAMITRHCANHPTKRNTNQIQIVTICNYSKYQLMQEAEHQAKQQAKHQANTKPTPSQHQEINTLTNKHLEEEDNTPPPPKGGTPLECLRAFEAYNSLALRVAIPQAAKLTPDRQRKISARLKEYGQDGWDKALANLERSAFLTGTNDRGWRATLDFLLQPASFSKLHDGGYGNGRHAKAPITISRHPNEPDSKTKEGWLREAGLIPEGF
jgi:hypothetical protein